MATAKGARRIYLQRKCKRTRRWQDDAGEKRAINIRVFTRKCAWDRATPLAPSRRMRVACSGARAPR
eukprot:5646763-Pyramimonas_sp.AAC.1